MTRSRRPGSPLHERARSNFDKLSRVSVDFTVNGEAVSVSADHPHLLSALRDELDITSPKDGCSPSGQCGCCTVLVDGKAVVSCNLTLDKVAGKSVVTLEGVDADERDRFAEAFAACGGLQCGFCIPGIVMRAKSQIDKKGADLDRTSMAPHLGAHLCRCTGYVKILDAIEAVAAGQVVRTRAWRRASVSPAPSTRPASSPSATAGTSTTSGCPARMHAALAFAEHARADVVAIDTAAAAAAPTAWSACSRPPTSRASCASASSTRTGR